MATPEALRPEQLCLVCDPASLGIRTTDDLPDVDEIVGQPRAVAAVKFGIDIRHKGYNIFVLGPPGSGRYTLIGEFLRRAAASQPRPDDWCYIHNFAEPYKPRAVRLPPGRGMPFREAMAQLIEELRAAIPAAFETEEYQSRRNLIESELKERQDRAFREVREEAQRKSLALGQSPAGFVFVPMRLGQVIAPDVFNAMPQGERDAIGKSIEAMEQRLEAAMRQIQSWQKESLERLRALNRSTAERVADHRIAPLKAELAGFSDVLAYLQAVRDDVIRNVFDFLKAAAGAGAGGGPPQAIHSLVHNPNELVGGEDANPFRRYQVNVVVHNGEGAGAPVIFDDAPTFMSLVGRIEYAAHLGQMFTDFTLIKPGSLHRANGGYLIVDVRKLLMQPLAYEELKRVLLSGQIRIESAAQRLGYSTVVSLEPEPIPLAAKIVLVGDSMLYHLLSAHDPEFSELFKVQAELSDRLSPSADALKHYARLVATLCRREKLRAFDAGAVARVIEYSARMVEDRERLSARFAYILDLLREADYWAGEVERKVVTAAEVEKAIDARIGRADHVRELVHEPIKRGSIMIETTGEAIGQVNGLSVLQLGNFAFGKPSRITARVRMGRGEVVDIERRVELGGPLHSKGVYILSGYLGAKYAADRPLALSASLVFEQSYGGVEGDSASSAELYALLSALAEAPVKQGLAVTGSVNQFGQVQAIGGVNEKVEGFFDICSATGLDGRQGVLIPAANVVNLMLRADVVTAVAAGRFRIFPVRKIDEGIELLTGVHAEAIDERVRRRLQHFAETARKLAAPAAEAGEAETGGKKGA
jgi:predicted ATP-dependent protease